MNNTTKRSSTHERAGNVSTLSRSAQEQCTTTAYSCSTKRVSDYVSVRTKRPTETEFRGVHKRNNNERVQFDLSNNDTSTQPLTEGTSAPLHLHLSTSTARSSTCSSTRKGTSTSPNLNASLSPPSPNSPNMNMTTVSATKTNQNPTVHTPPLVLGSTLKTSPSQLQQQMSDSTLQFDTAGSGKATCYSHHSPPSWHQRTVTIPVVEEENLSPQHLSLQVGHGHSPCPDKDDEYSLGGSPQQEFIMCSSARSNPHKTHHNGPGGFHNNVEHKTTNSNSPTTTNAPPTERAVDRCKVQPGELGDNRLPFIAQCEVESSLPSTPSTGSSIEQFPVLSLAPAHMHSPPCQRAGSPVLYPHPPSSTATEESMPDTVVSTLRAIENEIQAVENQIRVDLSFIGVSAVHPNTTGVKSLPHITPVQYRTVPAATLTVPADGSMMDSSSSSSSVGDARAVGSLVEHQENLSPKATTQRRSSVGCWPSMVLCSCDGTSISDAASSSTIQLHPSPSPSRPSTTQTYPPNGPTTSSTTDHPQHLTAVQQIAVRNPQQYTTPEQVPSGYIPLSMSDTSSNDGTAHTPPTPLSDPPISSNGLATTRPLHSLSGFPQGVAVDDNSRHTPPGVPITTTSQQQGMMKVTPMLTRPVHPPNDILLPQTNGTASSSATTSDGKDDTQLTYNFHPIRTRKRRHPRHPRHPRPTQPSGLIETSDSYSSEVVLTVQPPTNTVQLWSSGSTGSSSRVDPQPTGDDDGSMPTTATTDGEAYIDVTTCVHYQKLNSRPYPEPLVWVSSPHQLGATPTTTGTDDTSIPESAEAAETVDALQTVDMAMCICRWEWPVATTERQQQYFMDDSSLPETASSIAVYEVPNIGIAVEVNSGKLKAHKLPPQPTCCCDDESLPCTASTSPSDVIIATTSQHLLATSSAGSEDNGDYPFGLTMAPQSNHTHVTDQHNRWGCTLPRSGSGYCDDASLPCTASSDTQDASMGMMTTSRHPADCIAATNTDEDDNTWLPSNSNASIAALPSARSPIYDEESLPETTGCSTPPTDPPVVDNGHYGSNTTPQQVVHRSLSEPKTIEGANFCIPIGAPPSNTTQHNTTNLWYHETAKQPSLSLQLDIGNMGESETTSSTGLKPRQPITARRIPLDEWSLTKDNRPNNNHPNENNQICISSKACDLTSLLGSGSSCTTSECKGVLEDATVTTASACGSEWTTSSDTGTQALLTPGVPSPTLPPVAFPTKPNYDDVTLTECATEDSEPTPPPVLVGQNCNGSMHECSSDLISNCSVHDQSAQQERQQSTKEYTQDADGSASSSSSSARTIPALVTCATNKHNQQSTNGGWSMCTKVRERERAQSLPDSDTTQPEDVVTGIAHWQKREKQALCSTFPNANSNRTASTNPQRCLAQTNVKNENRSKPTDSQPLQHQHQPTASTSQWTTTWHSRNRGNRDEERPNRTQPDSARALPLMRYSHRGTLSSQHSGGSAQWDQTVDRSPTTNCIIHEARLPTAAHSLPLGGGQPRVDRRMPYGDGKESPDKHRSTSSCSCPSSASVGQLRDTQQHNPSADQHNNDHTSMNHNTACHNLSDNTLTRTPPHQFINTTPEVAGGSLPLPQLQTIPRNTGCCQIDTTITTVVDTYQHTQLETIVQTVAPCPIHQNGAPSLRALQDPATADASYWTTSNHQVTSTPIRRVITFESADTTLLSDCDSYKTDSNITTTEQRRVEDAMHYPQDNNTRPYSPTPKDVSTSGNKYQPATTKTGTKHYPHQQPYDYIMDTYNHSDDETPIRVSTPPLVHKSAHQQPHQTNEHLPLGPAPRYPIQQPPNDPMDMDLHIDDDTVTMQSDLLPPQLATNVTMGGDSEGSPHNEPNQDIMDTLRAYGIQWPPNMYPACHTTTKTTTYTKAQSLPPQAQSPPSSFGGLHQYSAHQGEPQQGNGFTCDCSNSEHGHIPVGRPQCLKLHKPHHDAANCIPQAKPPTPPRPPKTVVPHTHGMQVPNWPKAWGEGDNTSLPSDDSDPDTHYPQGEECAQLPRTASPQDSLCSPRPCIVVDNSWEDTSLPSDSD